MKQQLSILLMGQLQQDKMKHIFIFFIFGILISANLGLVCATGFSPSSLIYNLELNEESCRMITITSDSEVISIDDKWAENKDVEWKVSLFETDANEHGISIDYDDELSEDEREVEVCVSGSRVGEYHGVVLLKEGQQGNSIVQMGVWIKLIVHEVGVENPVVNNGGNTGSSSVGGFVNVVENKTIEESVEDVEEVGEVGDEIVDGEIVEVEEKKSWLTGAVVGSGIGNWRIVVGFLIVIIIAVAVIYNKRGRVGVEEIS